MIFNGTVATHRGGKYAANVVAQGVNSFIIVTEEDSSININEFATLQFDNGPAIHGLSLYAIEGLANTYQTTINDGDQPDAN